MILLHLGKPCRPLRLHPDVLLLLALGGLSGDLDGGADICDQLLLSDQLLSSFELAVYLLCGGFV